MQGSISTVHKDQVKVGNGSEMKQTKLIERRIWSDRRCVGTISERMVRKDLPEEVMFVQTPE